MVVPEQSLGAAAPPTTPVFFNPAASLNRDVSVALTAAAGGRTFCDSLCGVGSRGVRVAKESGRELKVVMVDLNGTALKVAERSARLNGVLRRCEFVRSEANSYLFSRYGRSKKFDFVDVDPFGTPAPFMQGALSATAEEGIASFTATDTAVLCGIHAETAMRRYGAVPLNNSFHHETAVRILINAVRRQAAALDLGVVPLLAHSTRHYVRVYVRVLVGPSKADSGRKSEGFLTSCTSCGRISIEGEPKTTCPGCGARAKSAGPLWVGPLVDGQVLAKSIVAAKRLGFRAAAKLLKSLEGLNEMPPWSFSIEKVCSALGIATVPESAVVEALEAAGFRCLRQPFEKTGLKTDASYQEVVKAVEGAGRVEEGQIGRSGGRLSAGKRV